MPADIALELWTAYQARRDKHPGESRRTLFKFLLWERFEGRMVLDSEIEDMAASSRTLYDLALKVTQRERPQVMAANRREVERELTRFFRLNAPDELP